MRPIPVFFRCVRVPRDYLKLVCSSTAPNSVRYCSHFRVANTGPAHFA
jgi:hypothetical protein